MKERMKERIWIFIGYSNPDEEKVGDIYNRLFAEGLRPWTEGRDLLPVDDSLARVRAAIRSSDFFLVCLSNSSVNDKGRLEPKLDEQLNLHLQATQTRAVLIPVRLEECRMPRSLDSFEPVDLFSDDGWPCLLSSINNVLSRRKEVEEAWSGLISELNVSNIDSADTGADVPLVEDEDGPLDGPTDNYSVPAWVVDLRRLINGKREHSLLHLGGVEEYVEMNLEEADDKENAQQAFDEALEKVVQTWQPSVLNEGYNITYLLDLIRLFTPDGGFVKVVKFIKRLRQINDTVHGDMISAGADLLRNALGALESYYGGPPKPPEDQSPAYKDYIDLLKEGLWKLPQSGYALRRLIELRVIDLKSDEIRQFIEKNPLILRDVVNLLLDPNRRSEAEHDLTRIFTYCLNIGDTAIVEFERAVERCGGEIEDSNDVERPIRITYDGEDLQLNLSDDSLYKFQEMRWKRAEREGFSRMEELANAGSA